MSDLYWYEYRKGGGICAGKCVIVHEDDFRVTFKPQFAKQETKRKDAVTLKPVTTESVNDYTQRPCQQAASRAGG